jgi:K+-transporting ATPase A subunit
MAFFGLTNCFILANQAQVILYIPMLAAAISLVYSASRFESPARIIQRATSLFLRGMVILVLAMGALTFLSWRL